uniref:Uncharacterized protein n=1 Tax=Timema tahoe TaxID=61484 RepID=A0A7R9P0B2_9NEOP|nr:unnamed protein product [Timema tahoe]
MAQTSITNYFNKRKRPIDDIKAKTKVMVLDQELFSSTESIQAESNCDANIVFKNTHEFPHSVRSFASIRSDVKQHKMVSFDLPERKAPKNYADKGIKVAKVKSSPGYDIRETFRKSSSIKLDVDSVCSDSREVVLYEKSKLTSQETLSISTVNQKVNVNEYVNVITEGTKAKPNVPFEQLGSLSPYKNTSTQSKPTNNVKLADYALNEAQDLDKQTKTENPNTTNDARKELGLMSPTKSFPRKTVVVTKLHKVIFGPEERNLSADFVGWLIFVGCRELVIKRLCGCSQLICWVALRKSHSPLMSSDRMKPRSGDWAVTIDFLQEAAITSLSSGSNSSSDHCIIVSHCLEDEAHVPDSSPLYRRSRESHGLSSLADAFHGRIGEAIVGLTRVASSTRYRREHNKIV